MEVGGVFSWAKVEGIPHRLRRRFQLPLHHALRFPGCQHGLAAIPWVRLLEGRGVGVDDVGLLRTVPPPRLARMLPVRLVRCEFCGGQETNLGVQ